jgi:gas vesicle protein
MSDHNAGSGFVIGFVAGAIVGLSIGFLFAPRPGEETREILKEKAVEVRGKASEVAHKIKETASEVKRKSD